MFMIFMLKPDKTKFRCSPRNLTPKNLEIKLLIWSLASSNVIFTQSAWLLNGSLLHYGWGEPAAIYQPLSDLRATWTHPEPSPPNKNTHTYTDCAYASSCVSSSNLWRPRWPRWEQRARPWRGTRRQPGRRGPGRRWPRRQTGLSGNTPARVFHRASAVH